MFSPAIIGVPLVGLGVIYFMLIGHRLLPSRLEEGTNQPITDIREYAVSMRVDVGGVMSGKTIADAGLRHLQYSFWPKYSPKDALYLRWAQKKCLKTMTS